MHMLNVEKNCAMDNGDIKYISISLLDKMIMFYALWIHFLQESFALRSDCVSGEYCCGAINSLNTSLHMRCQAHQTVTGFPQVVLRNPDSGDLDDTTCRYNQSTDCYGEHVVTMLSVVVDCMWNRSHCHFRHAAGTPDRTIQHCLHALPVFIIVQHFHCIDRRNLNSLCLNESTALVNVSEEFHYITSPGYPDSYNDVLKRNHPLQEDCEMVLKTSSPVYGFRIEVMVIQLLAGDEVQIECGTDELHEIANDGVYFVAFSEMKIKALLKTTKFPRNGVFVLKISRYMIADMTAILSARTAQNSNSVTTPDVNIETVILSSTLQSDSNLGFLAPVILVAIVLSILLLVALAIVLAKQSCGHRPITQSSNTHSSVTNWIKSQNEQNIRLKLYRSDSDIKFHTEHALQDFEQKMLHSDPIGHNKNGRPSTSKTSITDFNLFCTHYKYDDVSQALKGTNSDSETKRQSVISTVTQEGKWV